MTALGLDELPAIGPAVVTLGVFDGVHRGHRRMVDVTRSAADERGAAAVALVFTPHPDEVIRPGVTVPRLLPPAVTLERLVAAGIDHALELRFDAVVRGLEPERFLDALRPHIDLRGITMSPESAFGRGRAGTLGRVTEIGHELGFDTIPVDPEVVDGAPISSSRIRSLLETGDVDGATRLLAGPPALRGTVVQGDRRGRELGFPTANLAFDYAALLPALGIYTGTVAVPERDVGPHHPALVSIGVRPTFHEHGRALVEVYLLDWDGDLYDAELTVELRGRLRDELLFDSVDALVTQMRADESEARRRLGSHGG